MSAAMLTAIEAKLLSEKSDDGLCTQLENILNQIKYEASRYGSESIEAIYHHEDGSEDGELITSLKELGYEVYFTLEPPCITVYWDTPTEAIPEDTKNVINQIDRECDLAETEGIVRPEKHWEWAKFYAACLDRNSRTKVRDDSTYPPVATWVELVEKRKFLHLNKGNKYHG